jgi:hypothetical protein
MPAEEEMQLRRPSQREEKVFLNPCAVRKDFFIYFYILKRR